jgi:hypothetical protein
VDDSDLDPKERARTRRRDRDAAAADRALMDNGSAKWFKQVLDTQARVARRDGEPASARRLSRRDIGGSRQAGGEDDRAAESRPDR